MSAILIIRAKMAGSVLTQSEVSHVIVMVPALKDQRVKKVNERYNSAAYRKYAGINMVLKLLNDQYSKCLSSII